MHTQERSSLSACAGRWYIIASNFPMWLKGDKTCPTFNYRVVDDGSSPVLDDRVVYRKSGREKVIAGISRPVDGESTHFVWRGRGLLSLVSSRWQIFVADEDRHTAVAVFEKTLFTPSGADVISRMPELSDEALGRVVAAMSRHPDAAKHVDSLLRLPAK